MKTPFLMGILVCTIAAQSTALADNLPVIIPDSSWRVTNGPPGMHAHTRIKILDTAVKANASEASTSQVNTPSTIRSAYELPSTGGAGAIAIVDAYNYPTALNDFNTFSKEYGLPQETSTSATGSSGSGSGSGGSSGGGLPPSGPFGPGGRGGGPQDREDRPDSFPEEPPSASSTSSSTSSSTNTVFQVVYATGQEPESGGSYIASWNLEEALDIEWAHAMAPGAKIYLVEAASDSMSDLLYAVQVASKLPGVREVSMSWGSDETSSETSYDQYFTTSSITYFAAGGDSSDDLEYPSASPNVISVGGTTLNRNSSGTLTSETGWSDSGCGISHYEERPNFQNIVSSDVGNHRGANDVSFDANPNTGVLVYDSTELYGEVGWWTVGGTSLGTPSWAGVVNLASVDNGVAASSQAENTRLYDDLEEDETYEKTFRDITSGDDGDVDCEDGWDEPTGLGTPLGLTGK